MRTYSHSLNSRKVPLGPGPPAGLCRPCRPECRSEPLGSVVAVAYQRLRFILPASDRWSPSTLQDHRFSLPVLVVAEPVQLSPPSIRTSPRLRKHQLRAAEEIDFRNVREKGVCHFLQAKFWAPYVIKEEARLSPVGLGAVAQDSPIRRQHCVEWDQRPGWGVRRPFADPIFSSHRHRQRKRE